MVLVHAYAGDWLHHFGSMACGRCVEVCLGAGAVGGVVCEVPDDQCQAFRKKPGVG